jgi:TetR/AcrR family transcriptional regulator
MAKTPTNTKPRVNRPVQEEDRRATKPSGLWSNALPGREQVAELKRNAIIREAARAFTRKGFHGTSMDDIAKYLGVTKPALYRYVKTKHEILFASFTIGLDSGFAHLERAEREGRTGLEKLRIALRGYLEDMLGSLGHPAALLEENALLPEHRLIIIERRDKAEKRFREMVRGGIADGSIVPCDPKLAIFTLLGAVNWVPKWYRDDGNWEPDEVAHALVEMATRAIAMDPSPRLRGPSPGNSAQKELPIQQETSK